MIRHELTIGSLQAPASTIADALARRDLTSRPWKRCLWGIRLLTITVCNALYSITTCSHLQRISIVPRRPTRREIAEQDHHQLMRQAVLRRAADAVAAAAFAASAEVRAVALFGSVAQPLKHELPRFQPFRRLGIEILHECGDVDLAVAIDRLDNLAALNRARSRAVANLHEGGGPGVAHHQVDVFMFGTGWNDYLGRLCTYGQCPKGKVECLVPRCGRVLFLRQHEGFVLRHDALAADRSSRSTSAGAVFCAAHPMPRTQL